MGLSSDINKLTTVELLRAAARAANVNSSTLTTTDYIGPIRVAMASGNITAGDNNSTYTFSLQDSDVDTAANFTNISNTYSLTAASNVATIATVDIPTRELKKFFRVVGNIAGANSPSFPMSVTVTGLKQVA